MSFGFDSFEQGTVVKTILVVDSDDHTAQVLCKNLDSSTFNVKWVQDGKTAIKQLNRVNPDLLVLDLLLPKDHGYTVLKKACSKRRKKEIDVMVVSYKMFPQDKHLCQMSGVKTFIGKPVSDKELCTKVQNLLA